MSNVQGVSTIGLHAYEAVSKIGRGFKFADIKDQLKIDITSRDDRTCWRDTANGAYLFAVSCGHKFEHELDLLNKHIDQLIDDFHFKSDLATE